MLNQIIHEINGSNRPAADRLSALINRTETLFRQQYETDLKRQLFADNLPDIVSEMDSLIAQSESQIKSYQAERKQTTADIKRLEKEKAQADKVYGAADVDSLERNDATQQIYDLMNQISQLTQQLARVDAIEQKTRRELQNRRELAALLAEFKVRP